MATAQSLKVEIDTAMVVRIRELEELAASYAATNEAQRKRIDELLERITKANQRTARAEQDARDVRAWADAVPDVAMRSLYNAASRRLPDFEHRKDAAIVLRWLYELREGSKP